MQNAKTDVVTEPNKEASLLHWFFPCKTVKWPIRVTFDDREQHESHTMALLNIPEWALFPFQSGFRNDISSSHLWKCDCARIEMPPCAFCDISVVLYITAAAQKLRRWNWNRYKHFSKRWKSGQVEKENWEKAEGKYKVQIQLKRVGKKCDWKALSRIKTVTYRLFKNHRMLFQWVSPSGKKTTWVMIRKYR